MRAYQKFLQPPSWVGRGRFSWKSIRAIASRQRGTALILLLTVVLVIALPLVLTELRADMNFDQGQNSIASAACPTSEFEPAIVWGKFSLLRAKLIDAAWNIIAGRGAQLYFGLVTYNVTIRVLAWITEEIPVTYEVFLLLSFYPGHMQSLWPVSTTLWKSRSWKTSGLFVWILISTLWTLFVPTILDITTGYVSSKQVMVHLENGETFSADNCIITEISTVSLSNDTYSYYSYYYGYSLIYLPPEIVYIATVEVNCSSTQQTLDSVIQSEFKQTFSCAPSNPTVYSWGYSTAFLSIFLGLTVIWAIGTAITLYIVQENGILFRRGRIPGRWTAIADISTAMREDLGSNVRENSDKYLEKALKKCGKIRYWEERSRESPNQIELGLSSNLSRRRLTRVEGGYATSLDASSQDNIALTLQGDANDGACLEKDEFDITGQVDEYSRSYFRGSQNTLPEHSSSF